MPPAAPLAPPKAAIACTSCEVESSDAPMAPAAPVGDQQPEALGRGGLAKGRENVVQCVRVGMLRRVAFVRDTRGKGVEPGRELGETGALKGLEAPTHGLGSDEVR